MTTVLQQCYNSVTTVLQQCTTAEQLARVAPTRGAAVIVLILIVTDRSTNGVTTMSGGVTVVLQWCYSGGIVVL
jgi:hypothetical protein